MSATSFLIGYLFRWLPHASATGLFAVGNPDDLSPVFVTANFSLTVRRVRKALRGRDGWLLVADTKGINVWCAAAGGVFTANRVIDAIKVSRLADRVRHREIILPALAASGVDREAISRETGFHSVFGPVHAQDIPAYMNADREKSDAMRRFRFDFKHKLDMFVPMNFPLYAVVAIVLAVVGREALPWFTAVFWGAAAFLYLTVDLIPAKTGWGQAFISAALFSSVWAGIDWIAAGDPLAHWGRLVASFGVFFVAGFDLAGTVSPRRSDAEKLMQRMGFTRFGSQFSERQLGGIALDRDRCIGCGACREVCPVGVYGELDDDRKTTFAAQSACFGCGACVKQCPENALRLV